MPTEEQLSRVIRQGDPLGGNFEMNYSRGGQRFLLEHGRHCLLDGLRPGQRFHVHGEQVQNIAGWKKRRSRKFDRNYINYNIKRERERERKKASKERIDPPIPFDLDLPAPCASSCCVLFVPGESRALAAASGSGSRSGHGRAIAIKLCW